MNLLIVDGSGCLGTGSTVVRCVSVVGGGVRRKPTFRYFVGVVQLQRMEDGQYCCCGIDSTDPSIRTVLV